MYALLATVYKFLWTESHIKLLSHACLTPATSSAPIMNIPDLEPSSGELMYKVLTSVM